MSLGTRRGGFWKSICPTPRPKLHRTSLRNGSALGRNQEPHARQLCGRGKLPGSLGGTLLETIEQFGLLENSVVVFMADHGAMLGEHGQFLKGPDKLRGQVTHIPMLIHVPGNPSAGKKVQGFVQIPDVMPTVLGHLGLKPPSRVTGRDFWPLVDGAEALHP